MDLFTILSVVMFSLVYLYAHTYQIVYSKYGQFIEWQLDPSKAAIIVKTQVPICNYLFNL